jgi:hypothetical protein
MGAVVAEADAHLHLADARSTPIVVRRAAELGHAYLDDLINGR